MGGGSAGGAAEGPAAGAAALGLSALRSLLMVSTPLPMVSTPLRTVPAVQWAAGSCRRLQNETHQAGWVLRSEY